MEVLGAVGRMVFASGVVVAIVAVVALVGHIIERVRHRAEPPLTEPNRKADTP